MPSAGVVRAHVTLSNVGPRPALETVQAYVSDLVTSVTWAEKEARPGSRSRCHPASLYGSRWKCLLGRARWSPPTAGASSRRVSSSCWSGPLRTLASSGRASGSGADCGAAVAGLTVCAPPAVPLLLATYATGPLSKQTDAHRRIDLRSRDIGRAAPRGDGPSDVVCR